MTVSIFAGSGTDREPTRRPGTRRKEVAAASDRFGRQPFRKTSAGPAGLHGGPRPTTSLTGGVPAAHLAHSPAPEVRALSWRDMPRSGLLPGPTRPGGAASVILTSPPLRAAEVRITPAPVREAVWARAGVAGGVTGTADGARGVPRARRPGRTARRVLPRGDYPVPGNVGIGGARLSAASLSAGPAAAFCGDASAKAA